MIGYVILGTLAAFGLLSALWTAFGWLLSGDRGLCLVCLGDPSEEALVYVKWLKGLGLLRCPLIAVDGKDRPEVEICGGEALLARLEWEKRQFDGTGDGDHSGHHQCGGVPEL